MQSILKTGNTYITDKDGAYMEFVCDTVDDIVNLPTGANISKQYVAQLGKTPRPGSTAVVVSTGAIYILSNNRVWTLLIEGDV